MTPSAMALPNDVETLQQLVLQLHEALTKEQRENAQLEHRLEQLLKARYGPRADRLDPQQLLLFAVDVAKEAEQAAARPAKREPGATARPGHGRRRLPPELPREKVTHDLSAEEKRCPVCGEERTCIGQETSEQIEYEPAKVYVIEHIRPTYACKRCEGQVATAVKPLQPIEKGLAGPGLLAQVITSKYGDHQPLYRQEQILARSGARMPRSTTCGWMAACARLLRPLVELIVELVLASKCINTDDTPVPVLDPKRGKTRTGRIWVYVGDKEYPYTYFEYTPTRSRDGPSAFFGTFAGYIQADAYGGYDHLFKLRGDGAPSPTEVGCWAHARRKFVEAESSDALRAHTAVAMIRVLYEIEGEARDLEPAARQALRQEKALPQLARLQAWLETQQNEVLPKSPLGEAMGYCLSNWTALTRYTEDGDLAIDNNAAENALRPVALGRKNSYDLLSTGHRLLCLRAGVGYLVLNAPSRVSSCRAAKRSRALRGRNSTRDSQADGAPKAPAPLARPADGALSCRRSDTGVHASKILGSGAKPQGRTRPHHALRDRQWELGYRLISTVDQALIRGLVTP